MRLVPIAALAGSILLLSACGTTNNSNPIPKPSEGMLERDRYLIDPRTGFDAATPAVQRQFDKAVALLAQGRVEDAERRFEEIAKKNPAYRPAIVALARMAFDRADYDAALALIERSEEGIEPFTAAEVYRAEIALALGKRDVAYEIYKRLDTATAPPTVHERREELENERFEMLLARASKETGDASIATLKEALALRESEPARLLLAKRLVEAQRFEEARRTVDPVASKAADSEDVESVLAEVDMSRGEYQSAIARFERLARKHPETYAARLRDAKERFNAANMPPQYRKAYETVALTRADLAVLIYWKLSVVRFATNVGQPPIAVDIESVPGRDELIRALALGIYPVDSITRTVGPGRTVSRQSFLRIASRLLGLRGTLKCSAGVAADASDTARAQAILDACGVDTSALRGSVDDSVSGAAAAAVLESVDRVLTSAK